MLHSYDLQWAVVSCQSVPLVVEYVQTIYVADSPQNS